jgi:predicted porin
MKLAKTALGTVVLGFMPLLACAQSGLTVYGTAETAITTTRISSASSTPGARLHDVPAQSVNARIDSGTGNPSRLGFRGTEDLGGGLATQFVYELGYQSDTGAQGAVARLSYITLKSANGWSLSAGRQYSPLNLAMASAYTFQSLYWGSLHTNSGLGLFEAVGAVAGGGANQLPSRADNSLLLTKVAGPWTYRGMVGAGNEDARQSGRSASVSVVYNATPVLLTAGYTRVKQVTEAIQPDAIPRWGDEFIVGGSYDFGVARVFVGTFRYNAPNLDNASASFKKSPLGYSWQASQTSWIGLRVPIGKASALSLQAVQTRLKYASGPRGKANILAAAYEYRLSRRTMLYVSAARKSNNAYSNLPLLGNAIILMSTGYGTQLTALSVGVSHTF